MGVGLNVSVSVSMFTAETQGTQSFAGEIPIFVIHHFLILLLFITEHHLSVDC